MFEDRIDPSWRDALAPVLASERTASLARFLDAEAAEGTPVFPPEADRFRALELTPLPTVRAVILGQDPYHGAGQAHGLSFSVLPGVRVPPSLRNIYRELESDLGVKPARHGFLESWARQGVLLLNTVLSVAEGRAGSHRNKGWEEVTDTVVRAVAARPDPVAFLLWGAPAGAKAALVADAAPDGRHLVLTAVHPSPLSASRGWFGSRPFSQANDFLAANGRGRIDWALPAEPVQRHGG